MFTKKKVGWMKVVGVCITVSIVFGIIGGALTNEYLISYLFNNFIETQEENLPIVKKVIESHTYIEESQILNEVEEITSSLVTILADSNSVDENSVFSEKSSDKFYLLRDAASGYFAGTSVSGRTGFFISSDGLIATCSTGIRSRNQWNVITSDGSLYTANVVYEDPYDDLAFLQLNTKGDESYVKTLSFVENGIKTGQKIIASGLDASSNIHVKSGIIAYSSETEEMISPRVFPNEFVHIDFEIDSSLHCGPVINLGGELVGMALDFDSVEAGTSYVIPANSIKESFFNFSN